MGWHKKQVILTSLQNGRGGAGGSRCYACNCRYNPQLLVIHWSVKRILIRTVCRGSNCSDRRSCRIWYLDDLNVSCPRDSTLPLRGRQSYGCRGNMSNHGWTLWNDELRGRNMVKKEATHIKC
jgi:hypothetical protein